MAANKCKAARTLRSYTMSSTSEFRDKVVAKPRYLQILDQLRDEIRCGHYQAGDKLPTEAELMKQFEVSRTTVSRAMRDLESEGMLTRRQGSGTYVRENIEPEKIPGLCYFAPFVEPGDELPYVEGLIHQHLAQLAGQQQTQLTLQFLVRGEGSVEDRIVESAQHVIDSGVAGVLYYPAQLPPEQNHTNRVAVDMFKKAGLTVVLLDRDIVPQPDRSELTRIGYDNRRGAFLLTDHLIAQGCKRIAFIGVEGVSTSVADRMAGYFDALRLHGLETDQRLLPILPDVPYGTLRSQSSQMQDCSAPIVHDVPEAFCEKLMAKSKPDAIIGFADRSAALVGRHLSAMGLKIGEDILLAGFDDDPITSFLPVPMTTIRLPAKPFAEAAFETIASEIQHPESSRRQVIIDCELLVRQSTLCQ